MTYEEFLAYLKENSDIIEQFVDRATDFMYSKNEEQEEKLSRANIDLAVDGMRRQFTTNLYTGIHNNIDPKMVSNYQAWVDYIAETDFLDEVSESVSETEFE